MSDHYVTLPQPLRVAEESSIYRTYLAPRGLLAPLVTTPQGLRRASSKPSSSPPSSQDKVGTPLGRRIEVSSTGNDSDVEDAAKAQALLDHVAASLGHGRSQVRCLVSPSFPLFDFYLICAYSIQSDVIPLLPLVLDCRVRFDTVHLVDICPCAAFVRGNYHPDVGRVCWL